jgi:glucokinase
MRTNGKLAGIEIGGTKLQLCVADEAGHIDQIVRVTVDSTLAAENIKQQIRNGLDALRNFESVEVIGIGFGGPVDWEKGVIRTSHQIPGWTNFPFTDWLQQETGKKIVIDNDANVAALAEAVQGKGKGFARVFYMTIGSGIGGGFIVDGKIYHGRAPGEIEVGHIRLDKNGDTLESRCSGWAVDKKINALVSKNPGSPLAILAKKNTGPIASVLGRALDENDHDSICILNEITDDLSFGLSHVVHLLHPDIIVIGGGLSLLANHLLRPLRQQLPRHVMDAFHPLPPIEISALGEMVVPVGAIELAKMKQQEKIKTANAR